MGDRVMPDFNLRSSNRTTNVRYFLMKLLCDVILTALVRLTNKKPHN